MSGAREESVMTALQLAPPEGITLEDIADLSGYPAASCSAAIRYMRTDEGGCHHIESIPRGGRGGWLYRLESVHQ